MCGLVGFVGADSPGTLESEELVRRVLVRIAHRGPDGTGVLSYPGGAGGMVRLALLDPTPRGLQPLWSEAKDVAILLNGEIYNFRELRSDLEGRGFTFQTGTDTEVILKAYLHSGERCFELLRGMFAIAIFDFRPGGRARPRLVLARDPFGIKPLYLADLPGGILFCSEIKGVVASGLVPPRIDREALRDYLSFGRVLQPRSILEGVTMLEAGSALVVEPDGRRRSWRCVETPGETVDPRESLEAAAERTRAVIDESIRLHSFADVPVGAFLSGGIDSGLVVALMKSYASRLETFTLRFPQSPEFDETELAAKTARGLGLVHHVVDVTGEEVARQLPDFVRGLDMPSSDGMNTWLVSRAAAQRFKAVLSGVGGDEFFAGYAVTARMVRAVETAAGRLEARIAGAGCALLEGSPLGEWAEHRLFHRSPLARWRATHNNLPRSWTNRLLGDGAALPSDETRLLDAVGWKSADANGDPLRLAEILDQVVFMKDQLLRDSDATSMSHSLELRVPFVDREVAKLSRSLPRAAKVALEVSRDGSVRWVGKRVLRKLSEGILPDEVVTGEKKGFSVPLRTWLAGPLREPFDGLCGSQAVRARGLLDPEAVEDIRRASLAEPDGGWLYPRLWSLGILELWCREVLER